MIDINFTNKLTLWSNKSFNNDTILFAGYFHSDNFLYEKDEAIEYISKKIRNFRKNLYLFEKFFSSLNGSWAIILVSDNSVILASDIIRSIPIYYSIKNKTIFISDSTNVLVKKLNLTEFSKENIDYYKINYSAKSGYTILQNLYDVEAGKFIYFDNEKVINQNYFNMPSKSYSIDENVTLKKCKDIFDIVFKNMAEYFKKYSGIPGYLITSAQAFGQL